MIARSVLSADTRTFTAEIIWRFIIVPFPRIARLLMGLLFYRLLLSPSWQAYALSFEKEEAARSGYSQLSKY
jgi:hypothetical protein